MHPSKDPIFPVNEALVYSERVKSSKHESILPLTDSHVKMVRSSIDSESKIKVIDNFEAKMDQNNPHQERHFKSSMVPPLSDLSRTLGLLALLANSQVGSDQQSITYEHSSARKVGPLAISEGPTSLHQKEGYALENKNASNSPNHLECSPIAITEDLTSSFGSPGSPDLKKYIENPANDLNWLMTDKVLKRDNSFEEEVKTCRKQFLIETMTDFILNELISELKTEEMYFRKAPKREEQRINVQLLDDPRYVTESSDEETIYGIRTNMNAVYEYCNLLVRFILDNYLDLLLEKFNQKRVKSPKEVLSAIRDREVLLALPGNQWKEISKLKEYCKPKELFLPEYIFESLEQEIIVGGVDAEQLQQHEHHAELVRHAEGVPQVDLRLHKRDHHGPLAGRR